MGVYWFLTSITDAAEWYLQNRLRILPKDRKFYAKFEKQVEEIKTKYKGRMSNAAKKEYADLFNQQEFEIGQLNSSTFGNKRRYRNSSYNEEYVATKGGPEWVSRIENFETKYGRVLKVRRALTPGPFKKFRSMAENVMDINKQFRSLFGRYADDIFQMLTGLTFEEFLGFSNAIQYFQQTLLYLDPNKITADLLRSLGQGVNQMFAELQEITGADTLELSNTTEITQLSSSWLTRGWYVRMTSGTNLVSNGTLMVWDKEGKAYTINNCPESVWDKMKQAQGQGGHWYAPIGAGSWLLHYAKQGIIIIV